MHVADDHGTEDLMHYDGHESGAERLERKAVENPGKTAAFSLLTTPLAIKAGGIALRWARRNPGLALTVAAGALAWWGYKSLRQQAGGASGAESRGLDDDAFRFPGAGHGTVTGYGSNDRYAGRSTGGDSSSASSL
jgi:hypothetical protein